MVRAPRIRIIRISSLVSDLSGGVSITYHIKDKNPSDKDVNDTIAKLEERAESYTTEYSVYKSGDDPYHCRDSGC